MPKKPTLPSRGSSEIPNPQVFEAAQQFREAYTVMMRQGAAAGGLLLPAIHSAFIALELYLKSLSAIEVEVPHLIVPGLSSIHAQTAVQSHRLEELFDLAPTEFQKAMDKEVRRKPSLKKVGARAALLARNQIFMASRYVFEAGHHLNGLVIAELDELLAAIEAGIKAFPSRHV